jgi:dTDP-4-dehydrorhamnose reductase
MKVVVTGAKGMLGNALLRVFSDTKVIGLSHDQLDVTVLDDAVNKIKTIKPDFVIHAAAFTNVDLCESEPEEAYRVNGIGTRNVAIACEEIKCPVIYISSDYVFDGTKGKPYYEWDQTNPINQYGLSKHMGETFVSSLTNRFYILRTSWLYGENGRHFVDTIITLLSEREVIDVVNDQIGSPTYTMDLAQKIREIAGKGYGIYHVTNSGSCSWFDFARAIASRTNRERKILPASSDTFKRPARRPAYSVLDSTMLRLEGMSEMRHWEEALHEYLDQE